MKIIIIYKIYNNLQNLNKNLFVKEKKKIIIIKSTFSILP